MLFLVGRGLRVWELCLQGRVGSGSCLVRWLIVHGSLVVGVYGRF
jgi:hypothetical protein